MQETIDTIPDKTKNTKSKYSAIISRIKALEPETSLKVTCDSYYEAKNVRHGVVYDKKDDVKISSYVVGSIVWFWLEGGK